MTRFIACVCVGIVVLLSAPRANCQEVKRLGAAANAGTSDTVHNKGTALFDYDNDGFVDVLVASGLAGHSGQGIAVGDFDNDGRLDLFMVENARQNHLYRNRGDGTFEEVTDNPMIETIKIEGGKVEINGQSIKIEGAKVEIIRRH
jgi:FG-GAP-like repeat